MQRPVACEDNIRIDYLCGVGEGRPGSDEPKHYGQNNAGKCGRDERRDDPAHGDIKQHRNPDGLDATGKKCLNSG
jgi:hypothetical protein